MIVKTRVNEPEFIRLSFLLNYRRPWRIFVTTMSVLVLLYAIYAASDDYYFPVRHIVFAVLFVFVVPVLIYVNAKKRYAANLRLQEEIEYEFTDDRMLQRAASFTAERDWSRTHKIEEVKNFFLIYESSATFNMIPHSSLTPEEVNQLRYVLHHVQTGAIKKLK